MNMYEQNKDGVALDESDKCCNISDVDEKELHATKILSVYGKFQTLSLAMLCPIFLCLGMMVISPVFLNIVPQYECRNQSFSSMNHVSSSKNRNHTDQLQLDQCFQYSNFLLDDLESDTYLVFSNTSITSRPCIQGWSYDYSFGNTVVSQFDLICASAWKRPLIVSIFMFGMMVGSVFGGQLSDRYGRKRSTVVAFAIHATIETLLSFSPHYLYYIFLMFALGMVHVIIYLNGFVWSQELVHSADKRALASFWTSTIFAVGTMSTSLVAYLAPDWQWIYRVLAIINVLSCLIISLVSESPTWLLQKGKSKEAEKILKKIASVNKIEIENKNDIFYISSFVENKSDKKLPKNKISPLLLWKNKILRRRILIVCYLWINSFLGYYTMVLNAVNFGGSIYINNVIGGALDIGSTLLMIIMLKKLSRRMSLALIYTLFACFCVLTPTVRQANETVGVAFALVGRFFATAGMWISILYVGEIFPTLLRNTSVGIASMSARIGSIASPFLIFAGEEFDLSIPFYVMSGLSILGCLLSLLLPETSKSLPESLEDALALKDGNCDISCKKKCENNLKVHENNEV